MAVATYYGFEGAQLLFGAAVGLAIAMGTDGIVSLVHYHYATKVWWCIWSGVCAFLFVNEDSRTIILATLTPILGGFLLVSAGGVLACYLGAPLLPKHAQVADAAAALLGNAGLDALAAQGVFGIIGAAVYKLTSISFYAGIPCGLGILLGMLATISGFGCTVVHRCPHWLEPVDSKLWPLIGGGVWALASVAGTVLQLNG